MKTKLPKNPTQKQIKEAADALLKKVNFKDAEHPSEERQFRRMKQNMKPDATSYEMAGINYEEDKVIAQIDGDALPAEPITQSDYTQAANIYFTACEAILLNWKPRAAGEKDVWRLHCQDIGRGTIALALGMTEKVVRGIIERINAEYGLTNPKGLS